MLCWRGGSIDQNQQVRTYVASWAPVPESSVPCWLLLKSQNKSIGSLFNEEGFVCYVILVFCFRLQVLKALGYAAKYFCFSQERKGHRPLQPVLQCYLPPPLTPRTK